ncbi:MAG TPA: glycosyl hydrolase [Gaiellaceae bacterium]
MNRSLFKLVALLSGLLFVAAAVGAATAPNSTSAKASRSLQLGIYDDSEAFGHPSRGFALFKQLHVPVLRTTLWWGGPRAVAERRPGDGTDPNDPAYSWGPFDQMMIRAADANIKVMATIVGTPRWANGGKSINVPPKNMADLRKFATAVAKRYSGDFVPEGAEESLPALRLFLAWNEPNNPVFLKPQFKKVGKRFVVQSATAYARICNAIYTGVHSTKINGEKVGCGVTSPRGNNCARCARSSTSPLVFLQALHKRGAHFDVYAHNPYYGNPSETPATPPPAKTAVTLGNLKVLLDALKRFYGGSKHLWITEYGYQTKPPDSSFGVSWAKQSRYLAQAFQIAKRNPRIDMLIWFLVRDEPQVKRWQSGLMTTKGKKKPSFKTYARLER